jgi:hypothetical protein
MVYGEFGVGLVAVMIVMMMMMMTSHESWTMVIWSV